MWPMKLDAIPKRDQVTWCIEYLGMHSTFVVVRFILQYCSGKEYKGMASSVSDTTSSNIIPAIYTTSFLQFTPPDLTSTQATRSFETMECSPQKLTVCSSSTIWRSCGPIRSVPHAKYPGPWQIVQLQNTETAAAGSARVDEASYSRAASRMESSSKS